MLNLFAFRATDPKALKAHAAPIGPGNNGAIAAWVTCAGGRVVAVWDTHGTHLERDRDVCRLVTSLGVPLECVGTTKDGHPKHPLYLPNGARLVPLRAAEEWWWTL